MIKSRAMLLAGVSALAMLACAGEAKADPTFITPGMFSSVVPTTGEYALDILGASGGASINTVGGLGAEVSGDIVLTAGEFLTLFVGGHGQNAGLFFGGGGGGGGGFISLGQCPCCRWRREAGRAIGSTVVPDRPGPAAEREEGPYGGAGGANGTGGGGGSLCPTLKRRRRRGCRLRRRRGGGAGAGINSGSGAIFPNGGGGVGGGGVGGGGYGGGGGSGFNGGGGGGGLSGEQTAAAPLFMAKLLTSQVLTAGVHSGDGSITIDLLPAAVPEPSTWAMTLAGFAGLGWLASRRRRKLGPA